jgi:hypothetical protein
MLNSIKEGNGRTTDLNLLKHVKDLSWLSTAEMTNLAGGLAIGIFKKHEVILGTLDSSPKPIYS